MAEMKAEQKKQLAHDLYLMGSYTYEEIALKVGTTRQTVSRWANNGKWEELKAGITVTREQILKNMYRQINEINENILKREPGERHPNVKEADIMSKLSAAIKKMEIDVGITDIISVGMRFGNWMRVVDIDKAKELVNYWDAFLREQLN